MIRTVSACSLFVVYLFTAASGAMLDDRLTDKDVKELLDRIDQDAGRFADALLDGLDKRLIRTATGEVDVERYLADFEQRIDVVKDRFKPGMSASVEAADLLRQGTAIDTFVTTQAPKKGTSEWIRLKDGLQKLADAYGTAFPLTASAPVRRVNDREVVTAAKGIATNSDQMKKAIDAALKKDKAISAAERQKVAAAHDEMTAGGKRLASLAEGGRPSTAEAQVVLATVKQLAAIIDQRKLQSLVGAQWATIRTHARLIADAYKLTSATTN